ncbi:pantoate--beta-alanine ligase [Antarcticimicrobium sediminis]|uniref:Pantothenate synthetase n=1 Tax=Antarcticimicrobium sediminis TaxID=2546227 RepID=A0A4R5ESB2_9RHOB|nr:pantoate--beta-alanine ligase [Antarcticimicrobium sediminis]TDE37540.1 pantoate--beta-alanine ligase [Antarcticimicrobium sediminis]
MTAPILRKLADMRAMTAQWRAEGARIGVVPTMGALHCGHMSLVKAAKADCDRVIVWIFVNPKQFNSAQDLANYPRTEHEDAQKLAPYGIDAVYAPDVDQVYPDGFSTTVSVTGLTDVLCGAHRSGHFDGVATVVSKIFLQTGADRAYFGEKDFQQLQVVRRMARDLDIPIEVVACPTVRDPSGLALSSRNLRLSPEGLKRAAGLYPVLRDMAAELADGSRFAPLAERARARLAEAGFDEVEYLELRSEEGLSALDHADRPARLFAAVWIDGVRLIDNLAVPAV